MNALRSQLFPIVTAVLLLGCSPVTPSPAEAPKDASTQTSKAPPRTVSDQLLDLGDLLQGQIKRVQLELPAIDQTVVVRRVTASCACTAGNLRPLGSADDSEHGLPATWGPDVPMVIDVKFEARKAAGNRTETIRLVGGDGQLLHSLKIQANVLPFFAFESDVHVPPLALGSTATFSWELTSPLAERFDLEIESTGSQDHGWTWEMTPMGTPSPDGLASRWMVAARVDPTDGESRRRLLSLQLSSTRWEGLRRPELGSPPAQPVQTQRLSYEVVPSVYTQPGYLSLGMCEAGGDHGGSLMLEVPVDASWTILDPVVQSGGPVKSLSLKPTSPQSGVGPAQLDFQIDLASVDSNKPFRAVVPVRVGAETLRVSVFGVAQRAAQ